MISIPYKFLIADRDRHGRTRYYVRRKGFTKIKITAEPCTAEFDAEYRAALAVVTGSAPASPVQRENTWRWLCERYMRSAAFKTLHPSTKDRRLRELQNTWLQPCREGATNLIGDMPLSRMNEQVVMILRDRRADAGLDAANQHLKAIRTAFAWGKEAGLISHNPARDVRFMRTGSQGHHTWTDAEIERYKDRHPLGSKAHLALMLMLLTGTRRSDAVKLGRQHERKAADGSKTLVFTVTKNQHRKPVRAEIPLLPELERVLAASKTGDMTYLITSYGRPFSVGGFGIRMRRWCDQAGLPECSAHGLRKAAATTAAENGATTQQLMAMFTWMTIGEAERYTRTAERRKLAASGMPLLVKR